MTYNFEVEEFHTYYVGSTEVLVHNVCRVEYHTATRTDDGVQIGREISKKQALERLRDGKDVFTNSRSAAKRLAKKAFENAKPYSDIHEYIPNAMNHFHDSMNHIYHIFY